LVIGGLFIDMENLHEFTSNFLALKSRYFPNLNYPSALQLDRILPEIKGADLRRNATRGNARQRLHALGFLDRIFGLLQRCGIRLVARIWVKGIGMPFDAKPVYTSSIQDICIHLDHYLARTGDIGICIADSRNKFKNINVSHSIFTQKFSPVAQKYPRLAELPTFGHSDNHAGIQVCDIVCSALIFPIACLAYCTGHVRNIHAQPNAAALRKRYGNQLKALQYRYKEIATGRYRGGLVDASIIEAPGSTKNKDGNRDGAMHTTKKGNQWHFGMKARIGADAESGLARSLETTAANVSDVAAVHALLRGGEDEVWGDSGYQGVGKRAENRDAAVDWRVAMKRDRRKLLDKPGPEEAAEHRKGLMRAKAEHPFLYVKRRFGYGKVRCRGLAKNTQRTAMLPGFTNLLIAGRYAAA